MPRGQEPQAPTQSRLPLRKPRLVFSEEEIPSNEGLPTRGCQCCSEGSRRLCSPLPGALGPEPRHPQHPGDHSLSG